MEFGVVCFKLSKYLQNSKCILSISGVLLKLAPDFTVRKKSESIVYNLTAFEYNFF